MSGIFRTNGRILPMSIRASSRILPMFFRASGRILPMLFRATVSCAGKAFLKKEGNASRRARSGIKLPRHSKVKAAAPFKAPFKKEKSENKKNSVGFLHLLRPDDARSNAVYPAANHFCLLSALVYHIAAGLSTVCVRQNVPQKNKEGGSKPSSRFVVYL